MRNTRDRLRAWWGHRHHRRRCAPRRRAYCSTGRTWTPSRMLSRASIAFVTGSRRNPAVPTPSASLGRDSAPRSGTSSRSPSAEYLPARGAPALGLPALTTHRPPLAEARVRLFVTRRRRLGGCPYIHTIVNCDGAAGAASGRTAVSGSLERQALGEAQPGEARLTEAGLSSSVA